MSTTNTTKRIIFIFDFLAGLAGAAVTGGVAPGAGGPLVGAGSDTGGVCVGGS